MADIKFKVINAPDGLRVRTDAGTNFPKAGVPNLKNGSSHTATQTKSASDGSTWLKVSGGWCCQKIGSNTYAQVEASSTPPKPAPQTEVKQAPTNTSAPETITIGSGIDNNVFNKVSSKKNALEAAIDGSVRLFGMPHQFTESVDARLSTKSKLGRAFTETMVMEAPIIYIKPGTSKFLPDLSDSEKRNLMATIKNLEGDDPNKNKLLNDLLGTTEDPIKYFEFKNDYSNYMSKVNLMCRLLSVFLGIEDEKVPWVKTGTTFGKYDWRFYKFNSTYEDNQPKEKKTGNSSNGFVNAFLDTMEGWLMDDHSYIQLYVDANASFSESANNSTRSSMIEGAIQQIEGITKEAQVLSGLSGVELSSFLTDVASDVDAFVENFDQNGSNPFANVIKRLTGNSKQIIAGGTMLLPEIWDRSDFGKNYSFTLHLATPYGNKKSWFLNIGVPMMHLLALALPTQLSANVNGMPHLVRLFSPGWFSCELGIIDNIQIEKGGSGDAWALGGFASEYKVSISVKDLYSELGVPDKHSVGATLNNTGLLEYLMVMCGMDLTHPGLTDKLKLVENLFTNSIKETIVATPYEKYLELKGVASKFFRVVK